MRTKKVKDKVELGAGERDLTDDEIKIYQKQKEKHEDIIHRKQVKIKEHQLYVDEGYHVAYLENMDKSREQIKAHNKDIAEHQFTLDDINEKLRTGKVIIK